jgi:hypothetical protein
MQVFFADCYFPEQIRAITKSSAHFRSSYGASGFSLIIFKHNDFPLKWAMSV